MLRSMLLVAFLFSTSWGFSQTETCNTGEFTPVCNELGVVIRSNCNNCDLGDASCRQLVFDVFLYTQNQMPSTGQPLCYQDLSVTINVVSGQIADCKLQVFVRFDWTSQAQFIELHTFNFQLDFEAGSDIVLQSIDPNGAFDCPSSNNPAFCANCYFGTGTQSFVMCFKQGAPNGYLKINKGQDLVLLFDVPSNCIGDVVLRKAEFGLITYDMNDDPIFNDVCRLATPDPEAPLSSMQLTGFPLCVPLLTGEIKNYKSIPEAVEGVTVEVKRSNASQMCTMYPVTNCYGFSTCICGYDEYDVTPFKKDGVINGVSTYDLVLINKHFLGIELFDTPYKMIAADANNSKSVTSFDIAELRLCCMNRSRV